MEDIDGRREGRRNGNSPGVKDRGKEFKRQMRKARGLVEDVMRDRKREDGNEKTG